jgi:hypothetical protein
MYTHIVKSFWDRGIAPQNAAALSRFFRPHEIVFAAAALLCDRHSELPGIIGRDTIAPYLKEGHEDLRLDLDYLDQRLGGYGQVYRGGMADLGLILRAELNPKARLDAPFGELGASVADAFRDAISGTTYARRHAGQTEGTIPLGVIRELGQVSCFCRLADGGSERGLLVDVLLGHKQASEVSHKNRSATVQLFLDFAAASSDHPMNEDGFRRSVYWAGAGTATWRPSASLVSIWRRWWLVRHREIVIGALNALLVHLVRWGHDSGGTLAALPLAEYATSLSSIPVPVGLGLGSARMGEVSAGAVMGAIDSSVRRDGWPMDPRDDSLQEDQFLEAAKYGTIPEAPAYLVLTLLTSVARLAIFLDAGNASAEEQAAIDDGGTDRLSTSLLAGWVRRRVAEDASLAEFAFALIRLFVVRQHQRIARGKLAQGEDTFRFHEDAGSLIFVDQGDRNGIEPISMRFSAVTSALSELGLIAASVQDAGHPPTQLGQQIIIG